MSVAGERYFLSATYRMATERNKTAEVCIGKVKKGKKKNPFSTEDQKNRRNSFPFLLVALWSTYPVQLHSPPPRQ